MRSTDVKRASVSEARRIVYCNNPVNYTHTRTSIELSTVLLTSQHKPK